MYIPIYCGNCNTYCGKDKIYHTIQKTLEENLSFLCVISCIPTSLAQYKWTQISRQHSKEGNKVWFHTALISHYSVFYIIHKILISILYHQYIESQSEMSGECLVLCYLLLHHYTDRCTVFRFVHMCPVTSKWCTCRILHVTYL